MLLLEDLRDMLLGWAEGNRANTSDCSESDPSLDIQGPPYSCTVWVLPRTNRSNVRNSNRSEALLILSATKDAKGWKFILRVPAANAHKMYELTFDFAEGKPPLVMRQREGAIYRQSRGDFEPVRCFDMLVLDLIESRLPQQFWDHLPYFPIRPLHKACMACGNSVGTDLIVCPDCSNGRNLTVR